MGNKEATRAIGPCSEEDDMHAYGMMRRVLVMLVVTALAMGLFGCSAGKVEPGASSGSDAAAGGSETIPVPGGWVTNADVPASALIDGQQAVFDRATEGYVGVDLMPVCVLGTQVVAGTNYAYLCLGTSAAEDPEAGWYVVVVYEDLAGTCEVSSVEEVDVSEPALASDEASEEPGAVVGGWAVSPQLTDETIAIPEEAASAFAAGGEGYVGLDLSPLALLATQVVAGTDYRILCVGAPTVSGAEPRLYVVDVHEDLEGRAGFTDVATFDLLAYV